MELNLNNKTALVTGGSKGIGLVIKKALEKEGVKVTSWSRSEGVDLMDKEQLKTLTTRWHEVDFLINNVGGMGTCDYMDGWNCMKKNYGVTHILTEWFLTDRVEKAKHGRVITISSIYGKERGMNPWFTATKAAQIAYMKSLSYDFKYQGTVTFNTICPGHIDVGKPFLHSPPNIIGKPEDVANIVVFLCSDKAKYINGACITVDGGESHAF